MYTYEAQIIEVIDGDTIVVDIDLGFKTWLRKQSIRLYGIDTPEIRTKDLNEKAHGILAKERVESLIQPGDKVILRTVYDKEEKFGRILGIFMKKGQENYTTINDILIREKLAVLYKGQNKEEIDAAHARNREWLINNNQVDPTFFTY